MSMLLLRAGLALLAAAVLLTPPRAVGGMHFSYPMAVFSYELHPSSPAKPLVAKLVLLRFPGIGVAVRAGIGRNTQLDWLQLDGLNWWFWSDGYEAGLAGPPRTSLLDWTTAAERAAAEAEWREIVALGEGHDWLYQGVLDACTGAAAPAICAEALYRTGVSYRIVGYWHDPAWIHLDADDRYLDQRVMEPLLRLFPRSEWARRYEADLEALREPWRLGKTAPYPR